MAKRLTRLVTRTGDLGTTGMADGGRVPKNDARVHSLGEIDELNATIGVALSQLDDGPVRQLLLRVQHDLFDIGAELCQPGKRLIGEAYVSALEQSVEEFNAELPPLTEFILPGGSPAVAALQLARTVCRRAERAMVELGTREEINPETFRYINRLSDLIFVLARTQTRIEGAGETCWNSKYSRLGRDRG